MIAVDTNLLVYAHRRDARFHDPAVRVLRELAEDTHPWAIPWPCVHEFLAIVTHPRIYREPSELPAALDQLAAWTESPSLALLSEGPTYADRLGEILRGSRVTGARVHDARIAALCVHHRVRELWTADRDFGRFVALNTRNPLVE